MKPQIVKDQGAVNSVIDTITFFKKEQWYSANSNSSIIDGTKAKIWGADNIFHFEIAIVKIFNQQQIEHLMADVALWINFENGYYSLYVDYNSISSFSFKMALAQGYVTISGTFHKVVTSAHAPKDISKYAAIIDCCDTNFLGAYFTSSHLEIGDITYGSRLIELIVKEISLHCYLVKDKDTKKQMLFIESLGESEYEGFMRVVYDTILCISFITGAFIGKQIFIFKDIFIKKNEPKYVCWLYHAEDLKKSQFGVIPTLTDGIIEHNKLQIKHGLATLKKMIETCLHEQSYRRIILSMIHANTQPDYIRVVLFAVALETITELIYKENKDKMKPVPDKTLAVEIRTNLLETLQQFASKISEPAFRKFTETIKHINNPSNTEKLTKPFALFNIPLINGDSEAINKRNDFLHGRLPYEPGSYELSLVGYRLQYCVNSLVMKFSSYNGAVIYQASIFQCEKMKKADCLAYRII
jgi:hypothetical protein